MFLLSTPSYSFPRSKKTAVVCLFSWKPFSNVGHERLTCVKCWHPLSEASLFCRKNLVLSPRTTPVSSSPFIPPASRWALKKKKKKKSEMWFFYGPTLIFHVSIIVSWQSDGVANRKWGEMRIMEIYCHMNVLSNLTANSRASTHPVGYHWDWYHLPGAFSLQSFNEDIIFCCESCNQKDVVLFQNCQLLNASISFTAYDIPVLPLSHSVYWVPV